ncbi:MAG: diaminobutyrate acetyltransferase [Pseudonocardiaceae bacterium]
MKAVFALQVALRPPTIQDAPGIWELVRSAKGSDADSAYFYLLWCHEFSRTSVVATAGNRVVGFLLGYVRQDHLDTLVVWQEGVAPCCHVSGLRLRMLNEVVRNNSGCGVSFLETTATPHDKEVVRLVERFARGRDARVLRREIFAAEFFPDMHVAEMLYTIGPFGKRRS